MTDRMLSEQPTECVGMRTQNTDIPHKPCHHAELARRVHAFLNAKQAGNGAHRRHLNHLKQMNFLRSAIAGQRRRAPICLKSIHPDRFQIKVESFTFATTYAGDLFVPVACHGKHQFILGGFGHGQTGHPEAQEWQ